MSQGGPDAFIVPPSRSAGLLLSRLHPGREEMRRMEGGRDGGQMLRAVSRENGRGRMDTRGQMRTGVNAGARRQM